MKAAEKEKGVKLYGVWSSPFSKRVELALRMKGIDYEYLEQDLANKSSDLLRYNPVHKKVPVLVHDGKSISESTVIIEYIDETWKSSGPAILPVDPYDRAMARFWVDFIFRKCMEPVWMAVWATDEKEYKRLAEEGNQSFKILEQQLEDGKKFFGGENPGYVDIIAGFIAVWLGAIQESSGKEVVKEGEDHYPLLFKWKERFLNWKVAKETLPSKDKLAAHFRAIYEASSGAAKGSSSASATKS